MKCWKCEAELPKDAWLFYGLCDSCYNKGYRYEDSEKVVDAFNLGKRVEKEDITNQIQADVEAWLIILKENKVEKEPDSLAFIAGMKRIQTIIKLR